ncbi:MAG: hypothetical protein H7175_21085 [Burkholderiales bacterium]|nr:hypothetical protein [Anaerolineae bacterium]
MEFLQNIDANSALTIALVCGGLCIVGVVLMFAFQFLGGALGMVGHLGGLLMNIVSGGPMSWCGCAVVIGLVIGCGGLVLIAASTLSTCGTPEAVNFCTFLGR